MGRKCGSLSSIMGRLERRRIPITDPTGERFPDYSPPFLIFPPLCSEPLVKVDEKWTIRILTRSSSSSLHGYHRFWMEFLKFFLHMRHGSLRRHTIFKGYIPR